jgi:hypothetical protein
MFAQWLKNLTGKRNRKRNRRTTFRAAFEPLEVREMMAANLFVATTGNDTTGVGTIGAPYATLAKALSVAEDGDSVVLRGGTYAGNVRVQDPNITIRSHENEWAIISAPTNDENIETVIQFRENAAGGKLQRVEVTGGYVYGVMLHGIWEGVPPEERSCASRVIIEDSRIHHTGRDAIKITPGCDDVIIRRNEIYNTGVAIPSNAEGIDNVNGDRMIVQDNYIHDIATNGLYAKGGSIGTVIERNLIRNTGGVGIALGYQDTDNEWFDPTVNPEYYENINGVVRNNIIVNTNNAGVALYGAKNATVVHNTLIDVAQSSQAAIMFATSATWINDDLTLFVANRDAKIANNIVKQSTASDRWAFEIREGGLTGTLQTAANRYFHQGQTATFRDRRVDSDFSGGLDAWRIHVAGETGSSEGDPRVDANFHLLSDSPCIDAGSNVFAVANDIDGQIRSGTVDIGADEVLAGNAPRINFAAATSQGTESVTSTWLRVVLSAPSTQTVTVEYVIRGGTATSGADFAAATGRLTFSAGKTVAYVPLSISNDALDEYNETLTVTLLNPVNADLGNVKTNTYTILDDDAIPQVQFVSSTATIGESVSSASIPVRLSAVSGRPVTVAYRVVGGTARTGVDYQLANGTLTFQPGQIQKFVPVSVINDVLDELNETVAWSLSSPTNASLGSQSSQTITIVDNDAPPSIAFSQAASSKSESAGPTSVSVALSAPSGQTVRVNYAVTPGTATGGGVDYTANSGTLTFLPGETVKNVPVSITNDSLVESNETVLLKLSLPKNGTLGDVSTHTLTILDNDTPTPATQAFITFRLPDGHVYRISPEPGASPVDITSALNQLSPGTEDDNINASPDGRWLALTTDRFGIGSDWTGLAVVAADLSSGDAVRVNGQFVHPDGAVAIASGGNLVVYSASGGPHVRDLWAVTRSNGVWTSRLLTANSPYQYNSQPAISADGTKVLFDAGNEPYGTGSVSISEVRTDGTGFRQVITHAQRPTGSSPTGGIHHADYAPDGSIVFEAGWTGDQVWRLAPGTTQPVRLSGANNEVSPCVLPDGRIVTLWLNRPGNPNGYHELTVRKADGTYLFTLLPEVDVEDIGISCGG